MLVTSGGCVGMCRLGVALVEGACDDRPGRAADSPAAGGGYQRQARGTLGVGRRSRTGLERVIGVAAHAYDGIGSLGCGHAGTLVGTHASADSSPPASRPAARRTIRGCLHHLHA